MSDIQKAMLSAVAKSSTEPHRNVLRARALLLASEGWANTRIAARLEVSATSVKSWRERFAAEGMSRFGVVKSGRGRKHSIPAEKVAAIVHATQHTSPPGETHWSCRTMARAQGVSPATVQRIWSARGLKPHQIKTFKVSTDRRFEEKLIDVVGLYLNPPDKAVVLCMDEKSQIQALDRTQRSLPMKRGRAGTMTHDYKRNGTTTLFAALDVLTGTVISECLPRHRHEEFLKFLRRVDREVPKELSIHMILDNYGTHTHDDVVRWLSRHKRFHLHHTPTSSSWLNLVERWFRELTEKRIRRGTFGSVPALVAAIEEYVAIRNAEAKPFAWTATAESIIQKVRRGRVALDRISAQN
jgi:transposase